MTRRLLLASITLILAFSSGCSHFSKTEKPPKESRTPASDVAADFRKRWTDKRVADLVAQGVPATDAQTRAAQEFRDTYEYLGSAKK